MSNGFDAVSGVLPFLGHMSFSPPSGVATASTRSRQSQATQRKQIREATKAKDGQKSKDLLPTLTRIPEGSLACLLVCIFAGRLFASVSDILW